MKPKILMIIGPTAIGKSALGIALAKEFNGEVISGDAMQIYRELDIGTAKVTKEETNNIPHHLIDVKSPNETFTVSEFQKVARQKIQEILGRGHLPIIVGGSGLYIEALIYDVSHAKVAPNNDFRKEMQEIADEKSGEVLWRKLNQKDPNAAEKIHPNNVQRVIRALEVIHETGERFSDFQAEKEERPLLYQPFIIGMNTERQNLYQRIDQRVDKMIDQGLEKEVRNLVDQYGFEAPAFKGIGYHEMIEYLKGELTFDEAVLLIQKNSRHYAKRQLTWFRNRLKIDYAFDPAHDQLEALISEIQKFL